MRAAMAIGVKEMTSTRVLKLFSPLMQSSDSQSNWRKERSAKNSEKGYGNLMLKFHEIVPMI